PDRASVQFAVPANRINIPAAGSEASLLPLGRGTPWQPQQFDGQINYLARYAFIPDIVSISPHARLIMSGTPLNLGEEMGWLSHYYDYLYVHEMPAQHWIPDTDAFDEQLLLRGFEFQNIVNFDVETWVYFFHPGHNTSISYAFMRETETLLVAIGSGDAYTAFYHADTADPAHAAIDPALHGGWQFTESTSSTYQEWANAGEYIYYTFLADGTGEFMTLDHDGNIIRHFPFNWHVAGDSVTITYTTINLTLVYRFETDGNTLRLSNNENEHYLVFVM
ncbi:MAG: lipocalin family protein, partial [Defluviitaleaceae bacterium]|nr:lipocalin family protein [Defluviitaleaceae bacterium]